MTIEYEIIEDKKLVLVKGSGVVTGTDVLNHLDALAADTKYAAPMKKLIDYRNIDSIRISSDEAHMIAYKKKSLLSKFAGEKVAFVSPKDAAYGTVRVHQTLLDDSGFETVVFRKIDEALKWLDVKFDMHS